MFSWLSTNSPRSFSAGHFYLAFGLVEPHTVGLGPSIQSVQIPLQSLPTLKQINTPTQLGVICNLTEGALNPLTQIENLH